MELSAEATWENSGMALLDLTWNCQERNGGYSPQRQLPKAGGKEEHPFPNVV